MVMSQRAFLLYLTLLQAAGCLIYFFGFFPLKSIVDVGESSESGFPLFVNQQKLNAELFYKRRVPKLVVMLIDALRFDFVWGENSARLFPYLSTRLSSDCLIKMRTEAPTVTLPRIKSLVTGTVPSFFDVVRNFGSTDLPDDSFIRQAKLRNLTAVFYGDNTWLKLFPYSFKRHDGTTSFFVSDYTEVDENVTRHLPGELARDDWDIMILHYLGLDHIGHIEGPKSALVEPKLHEMDGIIQLIHQHLSKTTEKGVLIICGDHGMKDSGGHGGSSPSEIIVPFVLLNYHCNASCRNEEYQQIDASAIISTLLGLPVPRGSLGTLNLNQLEYLDLQSALYAIYYNTFRMWDHIATKQLRDNLFEEYEKGKFLYEKCIKARYVDITCVEAASSFYLVQKEISSFGVKESIKFELYMMIFGMLLLAQVVLLVFATSNQGSLMNKIENFVPVLMIVILIHTIGCVLSQSETHLCQTGITSMAFMSAILLVTSYNIHLLRNVRICLGMKTRQFIILIPTVLHSLTVFGSSFIEEDHEFWYFLCITLIIYLLWIDRNALNQVMLWSLLALTLRFLRTINQVGDKWSSLSDLSDWLSSSSNNRTLTGFCLTGLVLLLICDIDLWREVDDSLFSAFIEVILTFLQLTFVFLQKVASGRVSIWVDYPRSSGATEATIFWCLTLLKCAVHVIFTNNWSTLEKEAIFHRTINLAVRLFFVTVAFLMKPYNLIFIPSFYICCRAFSKFFHSDDLTLAFVHFWMGTNFYFMMGNWHNLASIDVSVGYTGLTEFSMIITGIYMSIHTYAALILSFLLLLNSLSFRKRFFKSETTVYRTLLFHNGLQLLLSSISTLIHRHHLFIWTVFAPKLLFATCQTLLVAFLVITSSSLLKLCCLLTNTS